MAYSTDLRESAVKYFLSHNLRYKDVADIFDVSSSTLHGWVSVFKKGGCLGYRTSTGRPRLIDRDTALPNLLVIPGMNEKGVKNFDCNLVPRPRHSVDDLRNISWFS